MNNFYTTSVSGQENIDHIDDNISSIYDIPVTISAVLGSVSMEISRFLKLGRGAVIELETRMGEPVDVRVNNRVVAKGEITIMDGEKIGITLTELSKR